MEGLLLGKQEWRIAARQYEKRLSDKFEGHILVLLVLLLLLRVFVYARKRARRHKLINLQCCQVSAAQPNISASKQK